MNWQERYDGLNKGDRVRVITSTPHCTYGCGAVDCKFNRKIGQIIEKPTSISVFVDFAPNGCCSGFEPQDLEKIL